MLRKIYLLWTLSVLSMVFVSFKMQRAGGGDVEEISKMLLVEVDDNNVEGVNIQLEQGADPNYVSEQGYTPLMHAAFSSKEDYMNYLNKSTSIMEALITAGADASKKLTNGKSILQLFIENGGSRAMFMRKRTEYINNFKHIINLLMQAGAEFDRDVQNALNTMKLNKYIKKEELENIEKTTVSETKEHKMIFPIFGPGGTPVQRKGKEEASGS